jgi:uncharacterized DUF497 family protein
VLVIRIRKKDLVWDDWNIAHIAKHSVKPNDVEEVLKGSYIAKGTYKRRILVIGKSGSRMLSIVLNKEPRGYYVVTARDASRRERRVYRDEKG